jgi:deoxyribodipyrimidine photolyase-like uncharacterized protein
MPEKVMNKLIYVPFDQLNQQYGALKTADPKSDHIVLIESQRMLSGRSWHKQRLQFLVSSTRSAQRTGRWKYLNSLSGKFEKWQLTVGIAPITFQR